LSDKTTLRSDHIESRPLRRRSALGALGALSAALGVVGLAGCGAGTSSVRAATCTDQDANDPAGGGRGCARDGDPTDPASTPLRSCSDSDPNDPAGRGRHC